jgi:hypothetical protein
MVSTTGDTIFTRRCATMPQPRIIQSVRRVSSHRLGHGT